MSGYEPERYELAEGPLYRFELDRRDFIKALGFGVLVLIAPAEAQDRRTPDDIAGWLHIGEDGAVRVFTGKTEVGQNIRTSLAQAVAEELRVPVDSIRLVMADTDQTPYDQGTFGSRTTPYMAPQLRKAAAAGREALLDLAAEQWKTDRAGLTATHGKVSDGKRSIAYGQLTRGQKLIHTIAAESAIGRPAGTSVPKVNGRDFVTGAHRYTTDLRMKGMLFGRVLRPPSYGATLTSFDKSAAEAMAGVRVVRDGDFAGVTAPDPVTAERAVATLRAEWKEKEHPAGAELFNILRKGSPPAGYDLQRTYTVAYIAHCPLEPRAGVAQWEGGRLTVWTGSQRPFGVRSALAEAFGLDEKQVRVIIPDTGSGYGGKHTSEAGMEAARLARGQPQPVKVTWTREEEFTWAYFRPAGVIDVAANVSRDGRLTAWEFHNHNSGAAGIRLLYDVPNPRTEFHQADSPLRQGSYRALAATANHFARESFIDEAAHHAGMDPLEFRRRNIKDPRLLAVLNAAAEKFGWPRGKPTGIACGFEKGGYVATCAEVDTERQKVLRLVTAFECGAVVNPEHLRNQIEGAEVMGLGGALFEAIEFDRGRILNGRLGKYRVPRFSDLPALETVIVNRTDLPSAGAGETPIVGVAPAIANAVFRATGERLRSLPLGKRWRAEVSRRG